jgi:L-arabinokinase
MGGIADYSGSLVLQMPIAEACHVALQRQPVGKQKVWKHVQVCADAGLPLLSSFTLVCFVSALCVK